MKARHGEYPTATVLSSDVSVVVQGPIVGGATTERCLNSIRRHLPGAEIVLSTWQGADTSGLSCDLLVENEDPGALVGHHRLPLYYNVNRQIVSTLAGLKAATKPYAVKVRSDIEFTGAMFIGFFAKYPRRCKSYEILKERVINCSVFAQNPHRHQRTPFHPSDWFMFGLREDLIDIWDIPLAPEPETSRWFESRERPAVDIYPHLLHRYFPEQYLWISFLRKHQEIVFEHMWDCRPETIEASERSFANNLIFLEPGRIGIRSLKYKLSLDDWAGLYSHSEWERLYERYCSPGYRVSRDWLLTAKNLYQVFRFLSPERAANVMLRRLLHGNPDLLSLWGERWPRSFEFFKAVYGKLTYTRQK